MEWFFISYGVLALAHIVSQVTFGHLEYRRQQKENKIDPTFTPSIGIIVPVYNEEPDMLKRALDSMLYNSYTGDMRVYVIDDGSKNLAEVEKVYSWFEENIPEHYRIFRKPNQGKRKAQVEAIKEMARDEFKPDVIVTVDSDTVLDNDALITIVQSFKNESIGAVTGHVLADNKHTNILTKLINYRYWMAFNQERAAQSYFDVLMCCSGPFSAYRGNVFRGVAHKYISQKFFGKYCTYGDDRHLTNLVLEEGWNVQYNKDAMAYTQVPVGLRQYLRQQLRWNKSFYREMLWTLKAITKHNWYLLYDLTMQFVLPFLLMAALIHMLYVTFTVDVRHIFAYIAIVLLVALARVVYGLYRTKDLGFYWFLIYGFFHVILLIPNRFLALATINDGKWGTR